MPTTGRLLVYALTAIIAISVATPAHAGSSAARKISAIDQMMLEMAAESARDAAVIKRVYEEYLDLLVLDDYEGIEGALMTGGLVPLPDRPYAFNLAPRLNGPNPIGEMDLTNQASYVAARPATIGALLEIASRITSGPIEITSLVRHGGYQDALRVSNTNATTSVPTHTMGLAIDIALVNTPLETAYEIRDVLLDMRAAGDLLFIGERHQLVFHVVPHPSRLGYFTDVYTAALGPPAASRAIEVVAPTPLRLLKVDELEPRVITQVVSIVPADDRLRDEWFAEEPKAPPPAAPSAITGLTFAFGIPPVLGGMLAALLRIRTSRQTRP